MKRLTAGLLALMLLLSLSLIHICQLKRHASWVQNVVRQFGPYLLRA